MPVAPNDHPFAPVRSRYLLLLFFALSFWVGLVTGLASSLLGLDFNDPLLTYLVFILSFSLTAAAAWGYLQRLGLKPRQLLGPRPRRYHWGLALGLVIPLICFSLGSGLLSYALLYQAAPDWTLEQAESLLDLGQNTSQWPQLYRGLEAIALLLVAPVAEEFLFRGVLLHRWAEKWGVLPALLLSSFLFGLGHANPIGLTVVGLVWALLYLQSGSLWGPILAHLLNNAAVYAFSLWGTPAAEPLSGPELAQLLAEEWPRGAALVAISGPLLAYYLYRCFPRAGARLPYGQNQGQS